MNAYAYIGASFENAKGEKIKVKNITIVSKKGCLIAYVHCYIDNKYKMFDLHYFEKFINDNKMFRSRDLKNFSTGATS